MEHRPLGASGIEVSALSLGSWRTFERVPRETGVAVMTAAREAGIDFLDDARYDDETAEAPLRTGYSEVVFGELFRATGWNRGEVVVANKLWWELWPAQTAAEELDGSLERVGLDYLDLVYSERPPEGLSVAEVVVAVSELIASGKARAWGILNWRPELVAAAVRFAEVEGLPAPCAAQLPDLKPAPRPVLATGRVRFVGEAVAVVVASDRYALRDALDLVDVDYEPLTPVVNPEKAIAKGAPVLHEPSADNISFRWELEGGDVKKAFKNADKVIRQRITNQRLVPMAMEPRGVLAEYKPGEKTLTVWSSTQIPHLLKTQIAAMLGTPEHSVRVITPEVGGGFGSKLNVYPEEAIVAHLSMRLGHAVKWMESRRENFVCTIHGRDQIADVEAAVSKDGMLLGTKWRIIADLGAYYQLLTPLVPTLTGLMLAGSYKVPAIKIEIIGALTNKMATDAYRGAGRPEAT